MFIKKPNACPCGYCKYIKYFEYNEGGRIIQKGVCIKHNELRELYDEVCEDFILRPEVHTNKWYPNKED